MFPVPKQADIPREAKLVPERGFQDVTVTKIECGRSNGGDPQMIWTLTVDNGPDAGQTMREYFTFKDGDTKPWSKLAAILDVVEIGGKTGFEWQEADSLEGFAMQFPEGKMRFSVDVDYTYQIVAWIDTTNPYKYEQKTPERTAATPHERKLYVDEKEWESWEGEKKGPFAGSRGGYDYPLIFQKPRGKAGGFVAETTAGGDGSTEEYFAPDDDLPF